MPCKTLKTLLRRCFCLIFIAGKMWRWLVSFSTTTSFPNRKKVNFLESRTFCVSGFNQSGKNQVKLRISASTGGLLSLCMGFSLLSLMEVFYYVILRTPCQIAHRKRVESRRREQKVKAPEFLK